MKVKEGAWKQGLWKCCKVHYCHCAEKDNFPKRNGDIYIIKSLSLSWQLKSMPSLPPMSHCRCACHMGDSRWLLWSTHNYLWIKMRIGVAGHNGLRTQGKTLLAASRSTTWGWEGAEGTCGSRGNLGKPAATGPPRDYRVYPSCLLLDRRGHSVNGRMPLTEKVLLIGAILRWSDHISLSQHLDSFHLQSPLPP